MGCARAQKRRQGHAIGMAIRYGAGDGASQGLAPAAKSQRGSAAANAKLAKPAQTPTWP